MRVSAGAGIAPSSFSNKGFCCPMRREAGYTDGEGSPERERVSDDELYCSLFGLGPGALCWDWFSVGAAADGCGVGSSAFSESVLLSEVTCG
jgi:hypothetical protein